LKESAETKHMIAHVRHLPVEHFTECLAAIPLLNKLPVSNQWRMHTIAQTDV